MHITKRDNLFRQPRYNKKEASQLVHEYGKRANSNIIFSYQQAQKTAHIRFVCKGTVEYAIAVEKVFNEIRTAGYFAKLVVEQHKSYDHGFMEVDHWVIHVELEEKKTERKSGDIVKVRILNDGMYTDPTVKNAIGKVLEAKYMHENLVDVKIPNYMELCFVNNSRTKQFEFVEVD